MSPRKGSEEAAKRIGVIYARYSSHNQKKESIEQQVEECMAFAALNHIKIIHVYSDKALSDKIAKSKSPLLDVLSDEDTRAMLFVQTMRLSHGKTRKAGLL